MPVKILKIYLLQLGFIQITFPNQVPRIFWSRNSLPDIFVQILEHICSDFKTYLFKYQNISVEILKICLFAGAWISLVRINQVTFSRMKQLPRISWSQNSPRIFLLSFLLFAFNCFAWVLVTCYCHNKIAIISSCHLHHVVASFPLKMHQLLHHILSSFFLPQSWNISVPILKHICQIF